MDMSPQEYQSYVKALAPKSPIVKDTALAFLVGGVICALGQLIMSVLMNCGLDKEDAGTWTSIILVGLSSLLTGLGWYEKLAKHAGAGTLVPITGFSNAISSCAIEARSEGYVLGVGTKIFTIAGPVILYGCSASVVYGVIYYLLK